MNNKLKIGLDYAAPVPLHTDFSSPVFKGFEVDLMQEIGASLDLSLQYEVSLWKDILQKLQRGDIDVICSAATVTNERKNDFDFSDSYLTFKLAVVINSAEKLITAEQLAAKKIGVRVATEAEKYIQSVAGSSRLFLSDTNDELYELLVSGEIDAVIDDAPIASGFIRNNSSLKLSLLLQDTDADYAIVVKKSNGKLKDAINTVLSQLKENGKYNIMYKRWFAGAQLV